MKKFTLKLRQALPALIYLAIYLCWFFLIERIPGRDYSIIHMKIDDKIADEVAWVMYDKQELISAHVMSEETFNKTKSFSFLTNVLKEGVLIG